MDTVTARVDPETLDILATLQPVPLDQFRLVPDCGLCDLLAAQPATASWNRMIRAHARIDHADRVIISSDQDWRVDVHNGNISGMDVRLDPLAEPIRCPHGSEFIALPNGDVEWLIPCRACASQTVAVGGRLVSAA